MGANRILIVEDEPGTLWALKKVLEEPNVEIDTASTIEDAVHLIEQRKYEAIVADLSLSGTGEKEGYEVIRQVQLTQPRAKVVVVTAHGSDSERAFALDLGAVSLLQKPVSPSALRAELRALGVYAPEF